MQAACKTFPDFINIGHETIGYTVGCAAGYYWKPVIHSNGASLLSSLFMFVGKLHFKALSGIGDTLANLKAAAGGEHEEWTQMYPRMAKEARAEGFDAIARLFENIAKIEKEHQERYQVLLNNLEEGKVFKKEAKVKWRCRECGFVYEGTTALAKCPVCDHPQSFFELVPVNY